MLCPPRALGLAMLVVAGLGCNGSKPAEPAQTDPAEQRKQDCDRFATDMARTGAVAGHVLITALDDRPNDDPQVQQGRAEVRSMARKLHQQYYDKCMGWPEEVMRCLPPLGILRDGCEQRLLAALDGATPRPTDIPAGPKPTWSFALESEPRRLRLSSDGTVVVIAGVESDDLVGLRDGAVAWRRDGEHSHWLLPVAGDDTLVATAEREQWLTVRAADGKEVWTATLPGLPDEDDAGATIATATTAGPGYVVGDSEARLFDLDPGACSRGGAGCWTERARLPDEILDGDSRLFATTAGERLLWEGDTVRLFDARWRQRATFGAHDRIDTVVVGDDLVMLIDEDLVRIEPGQCSGESTIAPSGWPQPGALVYEGADSCEDCVSPPNGCRDWRIHAKDADGAAPVRLEDGTWLLHTDGKTLGIREGAPRLLAVTGGYGPMATDGERVFAITLGPGEDDPPAVVELSPTDGAIMWASPLPADPDTSVYSDDLRIAVAGERLAVSYAQTVSLFSLPASTM